MWTPARRLSPLKTATHQGEFRDLGHWQMRKSYVGGGAEAESRGQRAEEWETERESDAEGGRVARDPTWSASTFPARTRKHSTVCCKYWAPHFSDAVLAEGIPIFPCPKGVPRTVGKSEIKTIVIEIE